MDVQGAVDSLLGTLASVIRDEARLLGNVRGDVQFIKDEMESMNGFLLHVNDASEDDDHQVRAWKKQVRDVAVDSERWVQRYRRWADEAPRGKGFRGYVRRIPHSVSTVWERHEIATKIQELKARAQEVGERRHRYGVEVPPRPKRPVLDPQLAAGHGGGDETEEQQYARRRHLEDPKEQNITEEDTSDLIAWLGDDMPELKAIQVVGIGESGKARLASNVFNDNFVVSRFARRSWVTVTPGKEISQQRIIEKLALDLDQWYGAQHDARTPIDKVSRHLQGRRFLIVFDGVTNPKPWAILPGAGGVFPAGSAVIVITQDPSTIQSSYYRTLDTVNRPNSIELNMERATNLVDDDNEAIKKIQVLSNIMARLSPDKFCSKMILRLLYVHPNMTLEQLERLCDGLHVRGEWNNTRQMLLFCYNDLPSDYRSCLQYLSIYPPGWRMRRTCLVRRWVADGLIVRRAGLSASDAAELCFTALLDRGLLVPRRFSATGKVTLVVVPDQVISFIVATARADNFADRNLPPDLAPYLSIGNGIQLQQVPKERRRRRDACSGVLRSIFCNCNCKHGVPAATEPSLAGPTWTIVQLLASLPAFERQGLLKVLDLEFCKGLRKQHLKNICQLSELRYLNLRGTDITELPEEIGKLQNLETLDIRQTKVAVLPAKTVFLRRLKHLLSGHIEGDDVLGSNELFSAVGMPHGVISNITELQILSHVEISCDTSNKKSSNDFDELIGDLERLRKLRKLGVVLRGETGHLHSLLRAIEKLDRCLRSLSIHFIPQGDDDDENTVSTDVIRIPKSVESMKISGFRYGLPSWALKSNNQLVKMTLQETSLNNSDLRTLAKLASLCCLRLRFITLKKGNSDTNYQLVLREDDFENLKVLVLEHTNITGISFQEGTVLKLEKMVWSYSKNVDALSGINHLTRLGEISLVGSTVSNRVKQAIAVHPNPIDVYYHLTNDANQQG